MAKRRSSDVRRGNRRGSVGARFSRRLFNASNPLERLLILAIMAVVVGIFSGVLLPEISPIIGDITGEYTAAGSAAETLQRLIVDDNQNASGYDRDAFDYRGTDDDGNGCDVRDDVLARDLTDVTYSAAKGCQVESGTLQDPYTAQTIDFVRGQATSSRVQIDHVVALENAWQSGARDWDAAKQRQFGNDMYNLLAVDGPANQEKGSASAAYWLPTNGDYRCEYVARQIGVKDKYDLTVTTAEKRAMLAVLHNCPAQEIPAT